MIRMKLIISYNSIQHQQLYCEVHICLAFPPKFSQYNKHTEYAVMYSTNPLCVYIRIVTRVNKECGKNGSYLAFEHLYSLNYVLVLLISKQELL